MNTILIVTEANKTVASGHLFECIVLADILRERRYDVKLLVNIDMPEGLKTRIPVPYEEYGESLEDGYDLISENIKRNKGCIVAFNLRRLSNEWLCRMKAERDFSAICIDELGQRRLDADVIINPMIDPIFWNYRDSKATVYAGPEYLILPRKIAVYHSEEREIRETVKRVCVSMGGVDLYGTTIKLAEWLFDRYQGIEWDVVIGAGFPYAERLYALTDGHSHVHVMQNIDYIYDVFEKADVAFCAGGNTLHELACIGTPVIVIPTMAHEVNNGKLFEKKGFGLCLSKTDVLCENEVTEALKRLFKREIRVKMSVAGRSACAGDGGYRTAEIIEKWIESTGNGQ